MFAGTPTRTIRSAPRSPSMPPPARCSSLQSAVVFAGRCHTGHRRRRRSRERCSRRSAQAVRRYSQSSGAGRARPVELEAGEVRDVHSRQQSALRSGVHRIPIPGTSSPDFAASQILADVLNSQRARSVWNGAGRQSARGGVRHRGDLHAGERRLRGRGAAGGRRCRRAPSGRCATSWRATPQTGVPAELVAAAKRHEWRMRNLNATRYRGSPMSGRTRSLPRAAARPTRTSRRSSAVTAADVNRVAKTYLSDQNSITAVLKPVPTGQPVATKGFGGAEQVTSAPSKPVQLPDWAASELAQLKVPADYIKVSDMRLAERHQAHRQDRSDHADRVGVREPYSTISVSQTPPAGGHLRRARRSCSPTAAKSLDRLTISQGTGRHRRKRSGGLRASR